MLGQFGNSVASPLARELPNWRLFPPNRSIRRLSYV